MIIYLHGPDSYRRIAKQKEIISEYKKKNSGLTAEWFYFDDAGGDEWRKFEHFVDSQSLFGGSRLAVVSGVGELGEKKELAKMLKLVMKDKSVFILLSENKKLSKEFGFLERKPTLVQQFDILTGRQFNNFLLKEALKKGVRLTNNLLNHLARSFAGDSWGAVMELEKLSLTSPPSQGGVGGGGLSFSNFQPIFNDSIFKLIYRLKSRNLKERLAALEILLANEDLAKVFNLTAYSVGQKSKFADYDAAVKSGKADYELALLDWVIS